ncbi:MAG: hypothetical protein A4E30_00330 [Methanomassiliicoccales archaeon PtaB.Bin215]|nr:MAG: hypothetical protein A4E30_00330 [Methanomassiliicoccales archaeon PtaB.Bin215]
MNRAMLLYGNGEARTTIQIEEDMSAPDEELLLFSYPYLLKLHDERMAGAVNKGMVGEQ